MATKKSQNLGIDDELVDEVVNEILAEGVLPTKSETISEKSYMKSPDHSNGYGNLESRIQELENKINSYVGNYKITAVELERQLAEEAEQFNKEQEKQLLYVQDQISELRTALIRLGNEFKKFKESTSSLSSEK